MIFTFYPDIIADVGEAEVISGETPFHFSNFEFLVVRNRDEKRAFKIIYEFHCSPFKEAAIHDNLLLVGHEEHFYLYDLQAKQSLLVLKMNWYFGALYIDKNYFFVADAEGLFCIDKNANIIWHNGNLGMDGVIIEQLTENQIHGSGEWDPPGGWKNFVLDKKTGKSTTAYFG
jgi:hypothetical protein